VHDRVTLDGPHPQPGARKPVCVTTEAGGQVVDRRDPLAEGAKQGIGSAAPAIRREDRADARTAVLPRRPQVERAL